MFRSIQRSLFQATSTGILVVGALEVTTHLPSQGRSSEAYHKLSDEFVTPLIRRVLNPEGKRLGIFFHHTCLSSQSLSIMKIHTNPIS